MVLPRCGPSSPARRKGFAIALELHYTEAATRRRPHEHRRPPARVPPVRAADGHRPWVHLAADLLVLLDRAAAARGAGDQGAARPLLPADAGVHGVRVAPRPLR